MAYLGASPLASFASPSKDTFVTIEIAGATMKVAKEHISSYTAKNHNTAPAAKTATAK